MVDQGVFAPKSAGRLAAGLLATFFTTLAVYSLAELILPNSGSPLAIAVVGSLVVYFLYRWRAEPPTYDYELREIRALAILSSFQLGRPLNFNDRALEPEALLALLDRIQASNAQTIVECGSGVSTILIGSLLRHRGTGHLYSLENDEHWHRVVSRLVATEHLENYVTVALAPARPYPFMGANFEWYDVDKAGQALGAISHIDMLLVDGPESKHELSRAPALSFLRPQVDKDSIIVLDDAKRAHEQAVLETWQDEFDVAIELRAGTRRGQAYVKLPDNV